MLHFQQTSFWVHLPCYTVWSSFFSPPFPIVISPETVSTHPIEVSPYTFCATLLAHLMCYTSFSPLPPHCDFTWHFQHTSHRDFPLLYTFCATLAVAHYPPILPHEFSRHFWYTSCRGLPNILAHRFPGSL